MKESIQRNNHLVRDYCRPFYENHLGAGILKAVGIPVGIRYDASRDRKLCIL